MFVKKQLHFYERAAASVFVMLAMQHVLAQELSACPSLVS